MHTHCYNQTFGNYLRARGEYRDFGAESRTPRELPPRTRRIQPSSNYHFGASGTTSAHAENTSSAVSPTRWKRNYLRARGEYILYAKSAILRLELPPRTRRIPGDAEGGPGFAGTTSAHAENTGYQGGYDDPIGNYLRARGEYYMKSKFGVDLVELPPRTRRILNRNRQQRGQLGTTSAHAENTVAPE